MTNKLIEAADELAEAVWQNKGLPTSVLDHVKASSRVQRALTAYRTARDSAGEVKVRPLVWECEAGWRWKGTPPDGFFSSVAKWVWEAPNGGFKHAGSKEVFTTIDDAKAAAQADYERSIRSALAE